MKKLLTVFLTLFYFTLSSQNPIVREEEYIFDNNEWDKVSILEYAHANGILKYEKQLYYEAAFRKWIPRYIVYFDEQGNEVFRENRFLISRAKGFFIEITQSKYNEQNQPVLSERFVKSGNDQPLLIQSRTIGEPVEDCSFFSKTYTYTAANNPQDTTLQFTAANLEVYDNYCEFAGRVNSDKELNAEQLSQQIRINFESLKDNQIRRTVERLICPKTFGCDDWRIENRKTYDAQNRVIIEEQGSIFDLFRSVTRTKYEANKTVISFERLLRTEEQIAQTLFSRDISIYDLEGKLLSVQRYEPFSLRETFNYYNEKALIDYSVFSNTKKDSLGITTTIDTTFYNYQYYCDGTVKEEETDYGNNFKTKKVYTYLDPTDCDAPSNFGNFTVYPNPTNGRLTIEESSFIGQRVSIVVYNTQGQEVLSQPSVRNERQEIDVSFLPNGVYILSIRLDEGVISKRFIVQ